MSALIKRTHMVAIEFGMWRSGRKRVLHVHIWPTPSSYTLEFNARDEACAAKRRYRMGPVTLTG